MTTTTKALLFTPAAMLASFYPAIITILFGIWPPSSMVHEVFGSNYFSKPFIETGFFFTQTGYGSHVLLSYPSYVLASLFVEPSDLFHHMWAFGVIYYLLAGAALFTLASIYFAMTRRLAESALLLAIPLTTALLEPETNVNLIINYGRSQEIVALSVAVLVLLRWRGRLPDSRGLAIVAGGLLALAVAIKFSNVLVLAPLIMSVLLIGAPSPSSGLRRASMAAAVALPVFLLITAAYNQFSLGRWITWFGESVALYAGGDWLAQRTPFLFAQLWSWQPGSFYLALKILIAMTALVFCFGVPWRRLSQGWSQPSILLRLALLAPAAGLGVMVAVRAAQGTMIDVSIFTALAFVLLWATREMQGARRTIVRSAAAAGVVALVIASVLAVRPFTRLNALAWNSMEARRFETFAGESARRIFYMCGLPQPLLFPSADQICLYTASASRDAERLMAAHCPDVVTRSPDAPLVPRPHLAIIPEFKQGLPETPDLEREWPQHWKPETVRYARLDPDNRLEAAPCRSFSFKGVQPVDQTLLYYSSYPMTVRACRIGLR